MSPQTIGEIATEWLMRAAHKGERVVRLLNADPLHRFEVTLAKLIDKDLDVHKRVIVTLKSALFLQAKRVAELNDDSCFPQGCSMDIYPHIITVKQSHGPSMIYRVSDADWKEIHDKPPK
jgi:hypothetical protein